MRFETCVATSQGGREVNEDYARFCINGKYGCWVVADGLGGHPGGEIASKIAANVVIEAFSSNPGVSENALYMYLEAAQASIVRYQDENEKYRSMRTTIVVLVSDSKKVNWAHIGDTRFYHFRKGKVLFQTKDHSVPQAMVTAGELSPDEIRFHEDRSRLLRVLGDRDNFRPSVNKESVELQGGDAFLLCTDGFWEYIVERDMEEYLARSVNPERWLHKMETKLKLSVNAGNDNYTAVGVYAKKGFLTYSESPSI